MFCVVSVLRLSLECVVDVVVVFVLFVVIGMVLFDGMVCVCLEMMIRGC